MKKKTIALLLACVMALGVAIGGTMAWLTDTTGNVTNTFTIGDIDIELAESGATLTGENLIKEYSFVPGETLSKDPSVIVKAKSEDCYLFVKVTESNNSATNLTGDIIQWSVSPVAINPTETVTWTKYAAASTDGVSEVWYAVVNKKDADQSWSILANNEVTVNPEITKAMVGEINDATKPELKLYAAAVQLYEDRGANDQFTVDEAYAKVTWPTT